MSLAFPASPTIGDTYTVGARTWTWSGTIWEITGTVAAAGSIGTTELAASAVTAAKIASDAVTTAKILDANITAGKIASGAAVTNIGYTPANTASPTFTGTVVLPATTSIGTVSNTEIGYVDGVTSSIQTQLDSKLTATTAVTSNRNKVINGGFDVWQRGTSFTLTNNSDTYTADRWLNWFNGSSNGTQTASRQTHTVGQTDVPGNPTYFFRWTGTTLGTGQTVIDLRQRIENVAIGAGQTVTFTYYAKSSSALASGSVSILFSQNFGSGGSSTVDTTATLSATSTTTGWVQYTATATLPSISGKTVGTSNYLQILMRFSNIVNGLSIDVSNAQLEAGAVATPFEFEDAQVTLAKCQRYYEKTYDIGTAPGTATYNGIFTAGMSTNTSNNIIVPIRFKVEKRTAPTMTAYRPSDGVTGYWGYSRSGASSSNTVTFDLLASTGCRSYFDAGAAWVPAVPECHWVASAEL